MWGDLAVHPKCSKKYLPSAKWFMTRFMVDAKKRKTFRLPGLLTSPSHDFWKWWEKMTEDATEFGDKLRLMTFLDHNSKARILAYGQKEAQFFSDQLGDKHPLTKFRLSPSCLNFRSRETITLCDLDRFIEWADPVALGCPEVQR